MPSTPKPIRSDNSVPSPFHYQQENLWAEDVKLADLAAAFGTPLYVYSRTRILENYHHYARAFGKRATICYAVKANPNGTILQTLAQQGSGADVVSGGELARALRAGMDPKKIVFAGVGKTVAELRHGLAANIRQFNVESLDELQSLAALAADLSVTAPVVLRLNPDVDAKTHEKITTGRKDNKFGLPAADWPKAVAILRQKPQLQLRGVGMHIGSQLLSLEPYAAAFVALRRVAVDLIGAGFTLDTLDLGGGLGIAYAAGDAPPTTDDLANLAQQHLGDLGLHWIIEPGRSIIGDAGLLLTRVIGTKHNGDKEFVIVDAAMNDLLRPSLYQAYHPMMPVRSMPSPNLSPTDIVGPVCETGDFLAQNRMLPKFSAGDLLAVLAAGAYGSSMASQYNSRPLVAEAMVQGKTHHLVRRRQPVQDLWALESPWPDTVGA